LESLPAPEPTGFPELQPSPAVRPPRRRGRTTLLIALAAVLGVVGGTATGYAVQAGRPPTPLAALSQPSLAYPAKSLPKGENPDPLSAQEDSEVKTDGDLRKLLVAKPSGAREAEMAWDDGGWGRLDSYSDQWESPDTMLEFLSKSGFRRVASESWGGQGNRQTVVDLVQFNPDITMGALDFLNDQNGYMSFPVSQNGAANAGDQIKGSTNGWYYLYPVARKAGYLPLYEARALAQRGDVAFDIRIIDSKPISKKVIGSLAERQLERL
jgi:hypothetical protein